MALQYIDGFDHYYLSNDVGFTGSSACNLQKWDAMFLGGEMYPVIGSGRFGDGMALRLKGSGGEGWLQKNVTTSRDEFVVGFAIKSLTAHTAEVRFGYASTEWIEVQLNYAAGTIAVVNADTSVNVVSGVVLSEDIWTYIQFRVKVHATLGEVEVLQNGTSIITLTAHDTGTTGDLINTLRLRSTSNSQTAFVDDLYLLDATGATNNTFLGDVRVDVLYPDANGATNNFTLASDTVAHTENWKGVAKQADITRDRDHSYVESGLVGASEEYTQPDLASIGVTPSQVFGVQIVNNVKRTDTGAMHYLDEMIIAGTSYDNGTNVVSSTGDYHMSTFIRDTDPSDSAAWTAAKVDAVGSGFTIKFKET